MSKSVHRAALSLLAVWVCFACPAGAASWEPIGPPGGTVLSMATDPGANEVIYLSTFFGGLYRSDSYGLSWAPVETPFAEHAVFGVTVDPGNSGTIYAATFGGGLFKSTDHGDSWTQLGNGMGTMSIDAVAVDLFDSDLVLAATNTGLYRSEDAGASWNLVDVATGSAIKTIAFHPENSGEVYLGTSDQGVFLAMIAVPAGP